jgi:hypothetical protein
MIYLSGHNDTTRGRINRHIPSHQSHILKFRDQLPILLITQSLLLDIPSEKIYSEDEEMRVIL